MGTNKRGVMKQLNYELVSSIKCETVKSKTKKCEL